MAHLAIFAVLIKVVLILLLNTCSASEPYELITPILDDRDKVITDAVDRLTLRNQGKLVTTSETLSDKESGRMGTFHTWLRERYTRDIHFRAFIVAVQRGVLPKLTLKEGATCNPDYVNWYKNPHNNMVEWRGIKRFVFKSYEKRNDASVQFCDFRLGLVCQKAASGKYECGCRDGAEMSPIKAGSSEKQCLLKKYIACALSDLEDGKYTKEFIMEMIWNPERPEGCQDGYVCRYTYSMAITATCDDPSRSLNTRIYLWPPTDRETTLAIGQQCTLGAAKQGQGQCEPEYSSRIPGGDGVDLIRYNYGPPGTREGYCAHPLGPYQLRRFWPGFPYKDYDLWGTHFAMGFVNPATTSFGWGQLGKYYEEYFEIVYPTLFPTKDSTEWMNPKMREELEACSVKQTQEALDMWNFFAALEQVPPPQIDFYDMKRRMAQMKLLIWNKENFCRVYWSYSRFPPPVKELPPLECQPVSPGGDAGNGKCVVKQNDNSSRAIARKVQDISDYMWTLDSESNEVEETKIYEKETKEPVCTEFQIGKPCPSDEYLCFKDYRNQNGLYDSKCNLLRQPDPIPLCRPLSIDTDEGTIGSWCEKIQLARMLTELVAPGGTKARDETCDPDLDQDVRKIMVGKFADQGEDNRFNLYARLKRLGNVDFGHCDRTRFLTCDKSSKKCVCYPGTTPRSVMIGGTLYESDYCYAESGSCNDVTRLMDLEPLNDKEKEAIKIHYGEPDGNCDGGNFCVFVDKKTMECTKEKTGGTGFNGTQSTTPPPGMSTTPDAGGGDGGGSLGGLGPAGSKGKSGEGMMEFSLAVKVLAFLTLGNIIVKYF